MRVPRTSSDFVSVSLYRYLCPSTSPRRRLNAGVFALLIAAEECTHAQDDKACLSAEGMASGRRAEGRAKGEDTRCREKEDTCGWGCKPFKHPALVFLCLRHCYTKTEVSKRAAVVVCELLVLVVSFVFRGLVYICIYIHTCVFLCCVCISTLDPFLSVRSLSVCLSFVCTVLSLSL